jgi:hypothetical protein
LMESTPWKSNITSQHDECVNWGQDAELSIGKIYKEEEIKIDWACRSWQHVLPWKKYQWMRGGEKKKFFLTSSLRGYIMTWADKGSNGVVFGQTLYWGYSNALKLINVWMFFVMCVCVFFLVLCMGVFVRCGYFCKVLMFL